MVCVPGWDPFLSGIQPSIGRFRKVSFIGTYGECIYTTIHVYIYIHTLPETNSSPLKIGRNPKRKLVTSITTIHFQVQTVSFREGNIYVPWDTKPLPGCPRVHPSPADLSSTPATGIRRITSGIGHGEVTRLDHYRISPFNQLALHT